MVDALYIRIKVKIGLDTLSFLFLGASLQRASSLTFCPSLYWPFYVLSKLQHDPKFHIYLYCIIYISLSGVAHILLYKMFKWYTYYSNGKAEKPRKSRHTGTILRLCCCAEKIWSDNIHKPALFFLVSSDILVHLWINSLLQCIFE